MNEKNISTVTNTDTQAASAETQPTVPVTEATATESTETHPAPDEVIAEVDSTVTAEGDATVTAETKKSKEPLTAGSKVTAKIAVIIKDKDFVLADVGGHRCMLHEKELAGDDKSARIERRKGLKRGQELSLVVLSVGEKNGKPDIRLSEKEIERLVIVQSLVVGSEVIGTVTNKKEYGAFLDLGKGVTGLLHVKELPGNSKEDHDRYLEEQLKTGQQVPVTVLSVVDRDEKTGKPRISLSLKKQVQDERIERLQSGAVTRGHVLKVEDGHYLIDLGQGLTGVLPVSEVKHQLKTKDTVKVKLDREDEDGTIHLHRRGMK
jgi:small subunit ribosomal protein S1